MFQQIEFMLTLYYRKLFGFRKFPSEPSVLQKPLAFRKSSSREENRNWNIVVTLFSDDFLGSLCNIVTFSHPGHMVVLSS